MAGSVSLSSTNPDGLLAFFKALATDDQFRALMESDPSAALAKYGISIEGLPEKITLPPKEALQAELDKVSPGGVSTMAPHIVFLAFFAFMR